MKNGLKYKLTVYGFDRPEATMRNIMQRLAENLGTHFYYYMITEG